MNLICYTVYESNNKGVKIMKYNKLLVVSMAALLSLSLAGCSSASNSSSSSSNGTVVVKELKGEELNKIEKDDKEKEKYNMIILTNGKSQEQRLKLKKLGLEGVFKLYISGETHISKPKEGAFLNVLESEGLLSEETMMIGDSLYYDIKPANKLGLKTCLVEKKWHFDDELKAYTGYKVKDIKQFFTELDKL